MNIVDVLIVMVVIAALVRGSESGLIRQLFSTLGFIGGIFIGVWLQRQFAADLSDQQSRAALALGIVVSMAIIWLTIGEQLGGWLKEKILHTHFSLLNSFDRVTGSLVSGVTVLVVVWLGAAMISSSPWPGLQRQLHSSYIVTKLDSSLPPAPDAISKLARLINPNGFPDVFSGLEPRIDTNTPLPSIGSLDNAVQKARASVVKIRGRGCGGVVNGSGFVADNNLIVTNAHVVAGVPSPTIIDANGEHKATVVWFDTGLDMAVLRSNDLAGQPLAINNNQAANGTAAAVLGYPGGGNFTANPAVILDAFKADGRDIYNQNRSLRDVYSLKADVRPGNSGGPLINGAGEVIGLIFAESTTYEDVGYALITPAVVNDLNAATERTDSVSTGSCVE